MRFARSRRFLAVPLALAALALGAVSGTLLGACGPFTDVAADAFCPLVLEIFALGITTGTTATTYDPTGNVTRIQMAAFLSRGVDGILKRSRRAALNQFWNPLSTATLAQITVGTTPQMVRCDGQDVWVANSNSGSVTRVRASDGRVLETWTGMTFPFDVLSALNRILVTGQNSPGKLYLIDPSQPAGAATAVATNLGDLASGMAFDGGKIWTANSGSVSIVTPGTSAPWTVTTVSTGFNNPIGALYDGSNVWIADQFAGTLLKLNSSGGILQTVTVGMFPRQPVFDGTNIWVPNNGSASATVVRASTGAVLATLTGNGIGSPISAAFDGQRVLITGYTGQTVSLWKAADLSPLGSIPTGASTQPFGAASDGINFWVTLSALTVSKLVRF
jgi:hypothetical protein